MATKKAPISISVADGDRQWFFDLATRRWTLTQGQHTSSGVDPMRIMSDMDKKRYSARLPSPEDSSVPAKPSHMAVRIKRPAMLLEPDQSSNLELIEAFASGSGPNTRYRTPGGEMIMSFDHLIIDPKKPLAAGSLIHSMAHAKSARIVKSAKAAQRQWWNAKQPTVDASLPTVSCLWPTAKPSSQDWEQGTEGSIRLGRAAITASVRHGHPGFDLSYEGLGVVMSSHSGMLEAMMHAGAVMHAMFGDNPPTQGVKTWVGRNGWEKKSHESPVQVEVLAATTIDIPVRQGTSPRSEPALLARQTRYDGSPGQWRWSPIPLDPKHTPDVRLAEPGDADFRDHIHKIDRAISSFSHGYGPYRPSQSDPSQPQPPEFSAEPNASPEQLLAAASAWIADITRHLEADPRMIAMDEAASQHLSAIESHLDKLPKPSAGKPASPKPSRR